MNYICHRIWNRTVKALRTAAESIGPHGGRGDTASQPSPATGRSVAFAAGPTHVRPRLAGWLLAVAAMGVVAVVLPGTALAVINPGGGGGGCNTYGPAAPIITSSLSPQYNFGVVQVGQTYTDPLAVTNSTSGTSGACVEGLNASFGNSSNTQLTGAGSITNEQAGYTNRNGAGNTPAQMVVTLKPVSAGAVNGTITVNLASNDGAGTITALPSRTLDYLWSLAATVVNQASPSITPNPVNFGNVRINSTQNQALSVENTATTAPQASLDAQLGATTGAATSNGGTISQLASGTSNASNLVVGLNTANAGAQSGSVAIALQSDSTPNGCTSNCTVNLPSDSVSVSGNVYRLANPTLNASSVNLSAARVGGTAPTATISVTNTSPDAYTEGLAANLGAAPTGFGNSGNITSLAAQGTDNASLHVALNTANAGSFSGNQAVNFVSNGLIDNAAPVSVGSQNVALTGNVYTPAVAQVNTASPIDFGIVHVGDGGGTLSRSISVSNGAAATALNDTLLGSTTVTNSSGSAFSGTGSLGTSGLGAGQTSSAMAVNLNTATAGIYSGTANLAFASHDSQLADLALAGSSLGVQAQVNNYAKLAFLFGSGTGGLSGSGNSYVFSFGNITQGNGSVSAGLLFLNDNPLAEQTFTDLLSSTGTITSGSGFNLSGDSVSGLAGGDTQGGFNIGFDTAHVGSFSELLSFNVDSTDPDFNGDIGMVTLELEGTISGGVAPVPEPGDLGMCGLGLLLIGWFMRLRRKHGEYGEDR